MTPLGIILQRSDVEQQKTLEASSATVGRTRLTCRETARQRIKKSVTPDFIICLEDGKRFKSLKRHIGVHYGLTPDEFRAKWGLASDYPMVAPNYAAARSSLAKSMGLGRNAKVVPPTPAKRGRTASAYARPVSAASFRSAIPAAACQRVADRLRRGRMPDFAGTENVA